MLLHEGRLIYFGPINSAVDYFTSIGFVRPESATTADFLTSVTSLEERRVAPDYESSVPRLADEFANVWRQSEERKKVGKEIADFNAAHPVLNNYPIAAISPLSVPRQILACFSRAAQRLRNNPVPSISAVVANMILGLIIGSAFHNTSNSSDSLQQRAILLFFSLAVNASAPGFEVGFPVRAVNSRTTKTCLTAIG
jgi:ATP-binding cassette, subfamily G (WHITE), member 2, PDR